MTADDMLAQAFGVDLDDPVVELSWRQLNNDQKLLSILIQARRDHFPEIGSFAKEMGVELDILRKFENDPIDFSLDFIRIYALVVGAEVRHTVKFNCGCHGAKRDRPTKQHCPNRARRFKRATHDVRLRSWLEEGDRVIHGDKAIASYD